jgi:HTH-type transcriptional regulator/antitoxin HigA
MEVTATWTAIDQQLYGELVREAKPHVIATEEDNEAALEMISALMERGEHLSPEERALLDLMIVLVERFEAERYPVPNAAPNDILRELLESNGLKQKDLVPDIGSKGVISEILSGKRAISKQQAKALAARFGVSPALFL